MHPNVVLPKVYSDQMELEDVRREVRSVQEYLDSEDALLDSDAIRLVLLRADYRHFMRKMRTVCVLVNCLDGPIVKLRGVARMSLRDFPKARIAKVTVDFDEDFMGVLHDGDALLVHFDIPVKGLREDRSFTGKDFLGSFEEVKVAFEGFAEFDEATEGVGGEERS